MTIRKSKIELSVYQRELPSTDQILNFLHWNSNLTRIKYQSSIQIEVELFYHKVPNQNKR